MKKRLVINLDSISEQDQARIHSIIHRRDTQLALKFNGDDVKKWKKAAESGGVSLSQWIEDTLNNLF